MKNDPGSETPEIARIKTPIAKTNAARRNPANARRSIQRTDRASGAVAPPEKSAAILGQRS
jgi:hypothetical protein